MTIQIKVRFLTSFIVLFLIATIAIMVKFCFLDRLSSMEQQRAQEDLKRVSGYFADQLSSLEQEVSEWRDLINNKNVDTLTGLLEAYSADDTLLKHGKRLVVLFSHHGRRIFGGTVMPGRVKDVGANKDIHLLFRQDSPLLSSTPVRNGVILLPEGPMLIAAKPVVFTTGNEQDRGVLLAGCFVDPCFLAKATNTTRLPFSMQRLTGDNASVNVAATTSLPAKNLAHQITLSTAQEIESFTILKDIYEKPVLKLSVRTSSGIYDYAKRMSLYLVLWFSFVALVAVIIINILLDKLVVTKIKGKEIHDRYQSIAKQASEGIVIVDAKSKRILEGNSSFFALLGYSRDDATGMQISDIFVDAEAQAIDHVIVRYLKEKRETMLRHKNGTLVDVEISANLVSSQGNDSVCLLIRDLSAIKSLTHHMEYEATHDSLTGLPNRSLLNDLMDRALSHDKRYRKSLVLILLDLDNFKIVNDTLGHPAGDLLLMEVASRLQKCVRRYDTVVRLGGDEFAIVMSGISNDNDITSVVNKINSVFTHPFHINGHEMFITCSVGISLAPGDGDRPEVLLSNADIALYHVKANGKNNYRFYTPDMNAGISGRLGMETMLRRAIDRNEFVLHYQPKIELSTGEVVGIEALLRWQAEDGSLIPPSRFIHLLDDTGLIVRVSEWVIREVCRQNRLWLDAGMPPLVVSTNISARHFYQNNLPEAIETVLHESGMPAGLLKIELTESIVMRDIEEATRQLNRLKEMGISLSIDDFGTGYASFDYLKQFPVDEIKIDKSFVQGLPDNARDVTIVSSLIDIAHQMNIDVVAEGVENDQQLQFLINKNCHQVQGFFFSKALPPAEFEEAIRSGTITSILKNGKHETVTYNNA